LSIHMHFQLSFAIFTLEHNEIIVSSFFNSIPHPSTKKKINLSDNMRLYTNMPLVAVGAV